MRFASEAWPRPGLAEPRSASIAGFGNTGPLSSTEQKGKDCVMTKTSRYKGLVLGSFLAPEIDMFFGDGVGASLVRGPYCQLGVGFMCFYMEQRS